jgi:hypothetical protein
VTDRKALWANRIVGHGVKEASQFQANDKNWRLHPQAQRDALHGALNEVGWVAPVVENVRTGLLVDGHERVRQALQNGDAPVPYVTVDLSEAEEAYVLATLDPIGAMAAADREQLDALLREVQSGEAGVQAMLAELAEKAGAYAADEEADALRDTARGSAQVPAPKGAEAVDIIWTQTSVGCCLATHMGWLYGIQSGSGVCPCAQPGTLHRVAFVDNDFKNYDHARHLATVAEHRPKYATVRDVMSAKQCEQAGITFYPLGQILDWADELAAYAEHVIVVPKYDCLDEIPDRLMLGYSVPTSYGGTPLPIQAFAGRRVHLLGGNPEMQMQYYRAIADSVVSLDNNQMHLRATFGNAWTLGGYVNLQTIPHLEGIETALGLWPSVAISLASFASWFRRDAGAANPT